jgi:hypothetical protein
VEQAIQNLVKAAVAKAAGPDSATLAAYNRWRVDLEKEGGGGGSGPRGGRIENPKTRGPKAPADTLPNPADVILAEIHRQVRGERVSVNPPMTSPAPQRGRRDLKDCRDGLEGL